MGSIGWLQFHMTLRCGTYMAPLFYFIKRLWNRVSHYYELKHVVEKGKGWGAESWKRESRTTEELTPHPTRESAIWRAWEWGWKRRTELTVEAEEGVGGGAGLLLHCEVVIQGHLLHPRHQALVRVHWSPQGETANGISDMTINCSSSSSPPWVHGHPQNNDETKWQ